MPTILQPYVEGAMEDKGRHEKEMKDYIPAPEPPRAAMVSTGGMQIPGCLPVRKKKRKRDPNR